MTQLSREKTALVIFSALIVLIIGGLSGYLVIGHNWNVAASNIDDAAGSMDDYTAIIFDGVAVPSATDPVSGASTSSVKPLTLSKVQANYLEKNATVFSLNTVNPAIYSDGMILMKGGHRFGVISVMSKDTAASTQLRIDYFKKHKVDFVVVISPEKDYVSVLKNMDIVVTLRGGTTSTMGETINGTFYISSPPVGQIGAILVSPSSVVSAKNIDQL